MTDGLESGLVSTEWLAQHLDDRNLRIYDCTVFLSFDMDNGIIVRGCQPEYEEAYIPGSAFLDLYRDLSVRVGNVEFMMPPAKAFSTALSAAGLGADHQVVLYSSTSTIYWATRLWWMLRASGFTNAAVLDGGLKKWIAEGRSTTSGQENYPPAVFSAKPDVSRWADKEEVLVEIENPTVCTINTLSKEEFSGTGEQTDFEKQAYGRKGRIRGSLNVPYASLLTEEGLFAPKDQLSQIFEETGVLNNKRIILYCGAGLSSTMAALALHLIGFDNVAIYDGSLNEWGHDPNLPMETD